jgi:hypothetical protein
VFNFLKRRALGCCAKLNILEKVKKPVGGVEEDPPYSEAHQMK